MNRKGIFKNIKSNPYPNCNGKYGYDKPHHSKVGANSRKDNKVHKINNINNMISEDARKVLSGINKDKDMRVLLKFSSKKYRTDLLQELLDNEFLDNSGIVSEKGLDFLKS